VSYCLATKVSFLQPSCLVDPIDIRQTRLNLHGDSLHAGVRMDVIFDPERIVAALCVHSLNERNSRSARQGRTAAEN